MLAFLRLFFAIHLEPVYQVDDPFTVVEEHINAVAHQEEKV